MPTSTPSPQRVLFVDDEPAILSGLGRMLRPLAAEIQSEFVSSGAEALARLAEAPFDVVVADIRMPAMDGASMLAEVRAAYPDMIRVVLSGHADVCRALCEVPVAHQFIAKPCDAATLRRVIGRSAALHALLRDRALQARIAKLGELPARPKLDSALAERRADPSATSGDLAQLFGQDARLTANLLGSVNTAFFALPRRVASIAAALGYLSTNLLRFLMLAASAKSALGPRAKLAGYDLDANQTHALLSANLAMQFFADKHARESAFAAGLLQNLGELLLAAAGQTAPAADSETAHAHVGAHLLAEWSLPYGVVEAVAHHHHPERVAHDAFELVDAVYVATLIADHCLLRRPHSLERARARLDSFGAGERLQRVVSIAEHWLQQPAQI
jgi:HD-like signal output (HDOD) protein/ActR/RegA family two-component response regulator